MLSILRYFIIFSYIFTICITLTKCYNLKSVNTYKKLTIEDDKVCSPITKRIIDLKSSEYQSVFISQTSTKDHNARWPIHWVCKFRVDSSSHGGLFAVIQNINFRKNITTGECIDYVQFRGKDGKTSKRICGNYPVTDISFTDAIGRNKVTEFEGQLNNEGKIDTEIYINREKLQNGETMDLEIVYTAFKRCNSMTQQWSCIADSAHFCINETFFNDSIVNCPFEMDCRDEGSCSAFVRDYHNALLDVDDSSMVTKVVLSAVTSLFVSFVCVIVIIWLCRKMGSACCLSLNIGDSSSRNTSRPQSRVIEMQTRGDPEDTTTTTVSSPASGADYNKDLPPSYDSLFPQR